LAPAEPPFFPLELVDPALCSPEEDDDDDDEPEEVEVERRLMMSRERVVALHTGWLGGGSIRVGVEDEGEMQG